MPTDSSTSGQELREPQPGRSNQAAETVDRTRGLPDRSEIEGMQLRKLKALLEAILPSNPFYTRKLRNCFPGLAIKSLEDFMRLVPITTRHEIVRDRLANSPYG